MKSALLILMLVVLVPVSAQNNPIMGLKDTLKHSYTTGGPIDSVDISFTSHSSTLPGGGFAATENVQPYDLFLKNEGGGLFRNFDSWKKMRFSALPHLGFGYVFGGQETQIVKTNYTHAFNENNLLNIDYNMQRGNNFLRNGLFNKHDVQLQYQLTSRFYSLDLKGQYLNKTINQNDGVVTDTLIAVYGLAFAPVRKENAVSKYRGARIDINHYFDFLAKDSLNATGLYIDNKLQILNRKYSEYSDTLSLLYPTTYLHLDSTNDQYQLSEIANAAGLYYNRKGFYLKAGILNNWWKYVNLGNVIERSELNLDAKLGITIKDKIELENHTNFNFIGAAGEWFSNTKLGFKFGQFSFLGNADVSLLLPEQYQRFYYSNNSMYDLSFDQLKKQFRMNIQAQLNYTYQQHSVGVYAKNATATNNYWFFNDTWRNDTLTTLNALSIGIKGQTGYKILRFSMNGSYNNSNWMPNLLIQGRLYIQGRMFKGRKLLGQFGVESSYHTGYRILEHLPYMDVYRMTTMSNKPMVNLHVFGAFEVSRFRFFFRVENLGSFWTDKTYRVALNQPLPAMQVRVGITWDFFN